MTPRRGEIWQANLDPTRGSEQAGTRPVLVYQNDAINRFTTTVVTIPFTSNVRRSALPSCHLVRRGDGGLTSDSVALCHQMRVLDTTRLQKRLGAVDERTMTAIDSRVLFTLGIV